MCWTGFASYDSILVLEEWRNRLETVEDRTGVGVFWKGAVKTSVFARAVGNEKRHLLKRMLKATCMVIP